MPSPAWGCRLVWLHSASRAEGEKLFSFQGRAAQVKCAEFPVFCALWSSAGSEQNQTTLSGRINTYFHSREEKKPMRVLPAGPSGAGRGEEEQAGWQQGMLWSLPAQPEHSQSAHLRGTAQQEEPAAWGTARSLQELGAKPRIETKPRRARLRDSHGGSGREMKRGGHSSRAGVPAELWRKENKAEGGGRRGKGGRAKGSEREQQ